MVGRMGAFEVSTVHEGFEFLFFSKIMSGMWPHWGDLSRRIGKYYEEIKILMRDKHGGIRKI